MKKGFSVKNRMLSFKYAFAGIAVMVRSQHNAWIHLLATVIVCIMALLLRLSIPEWCIIILAMMAVWTAEALNTAFEFLADAASPDYSPLVARAKDVAAAAVLLSAIGSAIIGIFIFLPRIIRIFN
jgi:diacylglycerol kinase (ATP)